MSDFFEHMWSMWMGGRGWGLTQKKRAQWLKESDRHGHLTIGSPGSGVVGALLAAAAELPGDTGLSWLSRDGSPSTVRRLSALSMSKRNRGVFIEERNDDAKAFPRLADAGAAKAAAGEWVVSVKGFAFKGAEDRCLEKPLRDTLDAMRTAYSGGRRMAAAVEAHGLSAAEEEILSALMAETARGGHLLFAGLSSENGRALRFCASGGGFPVLVLGGGDMTGEASLLSELTGMRAGKFGPGLRAVGNGWFAAKGMAAEVAVRWPWKSAPVDGGWYMTDGNPPPVFENGTRMEHEFSVLTDVTSGAYGNAGAGKRKPRI